MNNIYISQSHPANQPGVLSRAVAPIARTWLNVQDGVARVFGFKDSGNLSGTVTGVGVGTLIAAGAFPVLAAAGAAITTAGVVGLVENKVTKTLAVSDQKKLI